MENFIFCAKLGFNDSTSLIVTDYELIILFNNNWFQTLYFRNYCQTYQLHLHQFTRFVYFLLVLAITFLSIEVLRKIRIFLDCFRKSLSNIFQGRSQNFNQVPQNFMKVFNVDNVTQISQIRKSCRKINIASEKIINYRITFPNNHCCQIDTVATERLGILVIISCFLFPRQERVRVNVF